MRIRFDLLSFLLLAMPLCGVAQSGTAPGISFNPSAGSVAAGQTVTVTATGTWTTPPTIFCTTDGSPANIAANLIGSAGSGGGTISVLQGSGQSSETLNCIAATGAVTYQNVNASDTDWHTCIGDLSHAANGTPTATCSGGVGSSYPTSWSYQWGPTMTEEMTGGSDVQILAPFNAMECPLCDQPAGTQIMLAQSKTVTATVDSTILSNNEVDTQSVDAINTIGGVPIEHNFGLQCEQSLPASNPGFWAIDGTGKWIPTTITDHCPWPVDTPIQIVSQGWWTLGDTGCGGNGCFHFMSVTVNGTLYDLSGTVWQTGFPAGTLAQPGQPGWVSFFGMQDQMDLTPAGGTAGRTVTDANVTEAYYTPNPVTASATYATYASTNTVALVTPVPGSTLTSSAATFSWTPAAGATVYALNLGSTGAGSSNLYNSGHTTANSVVVTRLPMNGAPIYAELWAYVKNAWVTTNYTYSTVTATTAALTLPTPGSTLTGSSASFSWTAATGATVYSFNLGNTGVGSSNLYNSGHITATSATATRLPVDGETLNARLWAYVNGAWVVTDYLYTAATQTKATLTVPAPGSTLGASPITFSWTPATGASVYTLNLGNTGVGSSNIYNSGHITGTSVTVNNLPSDGETIDARLWAYVNNSWVITDYVYTAITKTTAALTVPAPGSTLGASPMTFSWTPATGATVYTLNLGSTGVGSSNLYNSGHITGLAVTVNNLPTNGETVYARLWAFVNNAWVITDYTYTAP